MPEPLYVRARHALLDAVEALAEHRDALVLVGAQAIYLHTGDANLAVAEYTSAPEDAGRVSIDLVEEHLDFRRRLGEVVRMELQVPVPPVQRPLLPALREPEPSNRRTRPLRPVVRPPWGPAFESRGRAGIDVELDADLIARVRRGSLVPLIDEASG